MSKRDLLKNTSFRAMFVLFLTALLGLAFAQDSDNDGMSDLYENFFKLSPTNSQDAAENYDSDLLDNLAEFGLWTDPNRADTDADGFPDDIDGNALSRAVILWGHPDFTVGDEYAYTGPDWWLGAGKSGGVWTNGVRWQVSSNAQGSVYMDLDRTMLTTNLVLNLFHQDASNSWVYVDLADENGNIVATNLFGDLTGDTGEQVLRHYALPLATYPTASRILIDAQAGSEPYQIWITTLYVDDDADGLDADQEQQVGTLDTNSDFDADNLTDYAEVIMTHTLPTNPDTDNDGFSDGDEVNTFGSDPFTPAWQEGGILGTLLVERWNLIPGTNIADLVKTPAFGNEPDERSWVSISEYANPVTLDKGNNYGIRIRGTITAPADGDYTFWLTSDDSSQVWLSETDSPHDRKLLLDFNGWMDYRDLSNPFVQSSDPIALTQNQSRYVEILFKEGGWDDHVTLWWTRPGQAEPEIIGAEYLRSYAQPADDQDQDGLSDALETACGLDPLDGTGGGYLDSDGDGFTDHEEINILGTSPTIPMWEEGGAPGAWQVERWDNIIGTQVWDLVSSPKFGNEPDEVMLVSISEYADPTTLEKGNNYGIRMRGTLTAPTDGDYTFWLTSDDSSQVWLSETGSPYDRKLLLDFNGWMDYRDLSNPFVQSSDPIALTNNQSCYVEVLFKEGGWGDHMTLWWTRPGQTEPEVIGSEYLHSYVRPADDLDMDGLSDALEIANGLDPQDGTGGGFLDSDSDGLSDHEELILGTDLTKADTDGDGLPDGVEYRFKYEMIFAALRWNEAKLAAEQRGGHLAAITSAKEYARVQGSIDNALFEEYHPWIGASLAEDGVWKWVTGEPVDFSAWCDHFPMDAPRWYWAQYTSRTMWRDRYVSLLPYLIEYEDALDPLNPDTDGDGLVDGDELANGSSPFSQDSDGDGLSDNAEVLAGTSPVLADTDGDGLSDKEETDVGFDSLVLDMDGDGLFDGEEILADLNPQQSDSNSDGVADATLSTMVLGVNTLGRYEPRIKDRWSDSGTGVALTKPGGYFTHRPPSVTYALTVSEPGIYRLAVQVSWPEGRPSANLTPVMGIGIDGHVESLETIVPDGENLPEYVCFTPWLTVGEHIIKCAVMNGTDYFEANRDLVIDAVELYAIDGEDADGNGIQDWMEAQLVQGLDSDGDGLSDADEVRIYGSDPLNADTDLDGLDDGAELGHGTDMLDADSDDDGVVDGVEVNESLTNPLIAEFDGTITVVETVSGSTTNAVLGDWEIQGSELLSKGVRGSVEYVMNFPTNDLLRLNISAVHSWSKSSCSPAIPKDTSAFLVFVDDVYVGKFPLVSADGVYVDVNAFLPVMPAGEHTVKLFWENVYSRLAVKIQSLELQSLGGPDNNGNGTKDWIEASISSMAGIDTVTESYVSPACVEGDARYVEFATLQSAIARGAGSRWYTNLPLADDDAATEATVSFQNGALTVPMSVKWKPYNLLDHNGATMIVRKGDALRITCIDPDRAADDLEMATGGQFEFSLNISGTQYTSPNTRPLAVVFDEVGTVNVNGTYTKGNSTISAAVNVVVVDGSFPEENPACLVGKERTWSLEGMPSNITFEVDSTVEMSVVEQFLTTNNNHSTTVALRANDTNGDHMMLARLYEGGPILASTKLDTFWVQNAVDGYFWTVERYEDSELWEVQSVAKNVPDSVDIQIKVIIAGVTLNDYTLERWLTNADYNETGSYIFRLFHPSDSSASTCHTFKLYQDGEMVGEAFGGGQNDIGEE